MHPVEYRLNLEFTTFLYPGPPFASYVPPRHCPLMPVALTRLGQRSPPKQSPKSFWSDRQLQYDLCEQELRSAGYAGALRAGLQTTLISVSRFGRCHQNGRDVFYVCSTNLKLCNHWQFKLMCGVIVLACCGPQLARNGRSTAPSWPSSCGHGLGRFFSSAGP